MKKAPAYVRFFPSDWLAGTRGLTMHETGVYITLVAMMYEKGEPLDADIGRLARLCGAPVVAFTNALKTLIQHGKIIEMDGARLWNGKVQNELRRSTEIAIAAEQSANARWQKNTNKNNDTEMRSHENRNANGMHRAHVPEPDSEEERKEAPVGASKRRKTGTRIPDDFQPDVEAAVADGVPRRKAENEAKRFCDYWRAKSGKEATKVDWPATWRVWYRRDLVPQHSQSPPGQPTFWKGDRI